MKTLYFKDDGVYLDNQKLEHITHFNLDSYAGDLTDRGCSRLRVKGIASDEQGNPIQYLDTFAEYEIDEEVIVNGLDKITQPTHENEMTEVNLSIGGQDYRAFVGNISDIMQNNSNKDK